MDNFTYCIKNIILIEGEFSNHPDDSGGATKYGITQKVLSAWRGHEVTVDQVRRLCPSEAEAIYKAWYWDRMNLDLIDSPILALCLLDQGINRGPKRVIADIQALVDKIEGVTLKVDGILGPKTAAVLNSSDADILALDFVMVSQIKYATLCRLSHKNLSFINGWLARTHILMKIIYWRGFETG